MQLRTGSRACGLAASSLRFCARPGLVYELAVTNPRTHSIGFSACGEDGTEAGIPSTNEARSPPKSTVTLLSRWPWQGKQYDIQPQDVRELFVAKPGVRNKFIVAVAAAISIVLTHHSGVNGSAVGIYLT